MTPIVELTAPSQLAWREAWWLLGTVLHASSKQGELHTRRLVEPKGLEPL